MRDTGMIQTRRREKSAETDTRGELFIHSNFPYDLITSIRFKGFILSRCYGTPKFCFSDYTIRYF